MNEDDQPLDREHYELMSNAGRCDWCGKPIDMSSGDQFLVSEQVELEDDRFDRQDVANAIADALEQIGGPEDEMLADEIREKEDWGVHGRCYDESSLPAIYGEREGFEDV